MKNQNFHSRLCQKFLCKYYIYIPNVKTVVIVYITENKNKIDFEEIFLKQMFSNQELILKIDGSLPKFGKQIRDMRDN